jgi:hypothetical protein
MHAVGLPSMLANSEPDRHRAVKAAAAQGAVALRASPDGSVPTWQWLGKAFKAKRGCRGSPDITRDVSGEASEDDCQSRYL